MMFIDYIIKEINEIIKWIIKKMIIELKWYLDDDDCYSWDDD